MPGTLFRIQISTCANCNKFNLKNAKFLSGSISLSESTFSKASNRILNLDEIIVVKNLTGKKKSEKNVFDRYYKGKEVFKTRYFGR